jgi:DNA-binding transcriptional MerR regulator
MFRGIALEIDAASTSRLVGMDWSIQEIARLAGTTSRTLRHYDDVGLVPQRVLLLRELGLGIPAIAEVLDGQRDDIDALRTHLGWLRQEKGRLDRQIASVEATVTRMEGGEEPMAGDMFDGFDHTRYKDEVEQRWGADAYRRSDAWWRSLTAEQKAEWKGLAQRLGEDWIAAAETGIDPASDEAQELAQRQFDWLRGIPGTPGGGGAGPTKEYFVGLAEMYVADDRFAANYGGTSGAEFVRDAMRVYAERRL